LKIGIFLEFGACILGFNYPLVATSEHYIGFQPALSTQILPPKGFVALHQKKQSEKGFIFRNAVLTKLK
jgi:hypothetical protein